VKKLDSDPIASAIASCNSEEKKVRIARYKLTIVEKKLQLSFKLFYSVAETWCIQRNIVIVAHKTK